MAGIGLAAAAAARSGSAAAARLAARGFAADGGTARTLAAAGQLVAEVLEGAMAALRSTAARLAAAGSGTAARFAGRGRTAARLAAARGGVTARAAARGATTTIVRDAVAVPHAVHKAEGLGVLGGREGKTQRQAEDGENKSNLHGEGSFTNTQFREIRGVFPLLPGRIDDHFRVALTCGFSFGFFGLCRTSRQRKDYRPGTS